LNILNKVLTYSLEELLWIKEEDDILK